MKLNVRAMSITSSVLWGGAVLTVGLVNLIEPKYGRQFLNLIRSIYPGYHAQPNLKDVVVGTGYALLDGAVGGAILAGLYNQLEHSESGQQKLSRAA